MKLFIKSFRVWWQKPADPTQRDAHREVSMLELFYDLVYVAIIIQLTHLVVGHISISSVGTYLSLFLMMFWAWFNGSLYHELHGNLDLKTRIIIFLQMLCLIDIGIFIHSAFGEGYRGFALFYGLFLSIIGVLWWRTGVHNPIQKTVAQPFVRLFSITVVAFFVSMFTPEKISHIIWFSSIAGSLIYAVILIIRPNKKADTKQLQAVKHIGASFVERFGLIATIILGEGVASVVSGSTHIHHWGVLEVFNVMGSFILLAFIWWLYFDFISRRLPKDNNISKGIWIGVHFPLLVSLGLVSAGILNLLEYASTFTISDKLIIVVPLVVFLLCCLVLMETVQVS
ncbi:MAG: low temperature requirement protein A, partial [Flavobacteriaceae bacterium]|nr:low temperature requirement protein A [Flavobacteriaceae bacterium]